MHCKDAEDLVTDQLTKPEKGALIIDASPLEHILVDAKPGATRGMQRAKPGFDDAVKEVVDNQAKYGRKIGVLESQVDELKQLNERMALIGGYIPAVKKLLEMMVESQTILDNRRHEIIRVVAKTVEAQAAAMKDDVLLAKYEDTRKYRSATAYKAAKTRQKKAAAVIPQAETTE